MKKKTKTQLIKLADKKFSDHWRKEVGRCENCGKKDSLQVAHIISRNCRKLRYERDNIFILCWSCHWRFHSKPLEFSEFVKNKKGKGIYEYLLKSSHILKPLSEDYYNQIIKKL